MKEKIAKVFGTVPFLKSPPVIFGLCLFFAMLCLEHVKDPYQRTFSDISVHGTNVTVISVTPKELHAPYPTVIYLHGSRGSAIGNGRVLRQFSDAGFAAVTMEYSQGSQPEFNQEMPALMSWINNQGWADTNRLVWVGFSLGAQRMLEYYLTQSGTAPKTLVRLAGGLVEGLDGIGDEKTIKPKHDGLPRVMMFHAQDDRVFPLEDMQKVAAWFASMGCQVSTKVLPHASHAFGMDREWVIRCIADAVADDMGVQRAGSRPFGMLYTAKTALAAILVFLACWLGPKLFRAEPGESKWFRKLAVSVFILASLVTAYHLILPRVLQAGEHVSWFAHDLETDAEREDLKWLASLPEYQHQTCYDVMEQVRLAHFRKSFLYSALEPEKFHGCVLNPQITPDQVPQMQWRWPLWLELYPKIRKCTSAEEAVEIVIRATRERLGLPKEKAAEKDILSMWWGGEAPTAAYQKILVAALRSVGVASRLKSGRAEFWTGKEWQVVLEKDNPFLVNDRYDEFYSVLAHENAGH